MKIVHFEIFLFSLISKMLRTRSLKCENSLQLLWNKKSNLLNRVFGVQLQ